jgi:hypothetical protein
LEKEYERLRTPEALNEWSAENRKRATAYHSDCGNQATYYVDDSFRFWRDLPRDYVQHSLEMPKQKSRKYLIRLSMERATGIETELPVS